LPPAFGVLAIAPYALAAVALSAFG
jgi:hypothetical protein